MSCHNINKKGFVVKVYRQLVCLLLVVNSYSQPCMARALTTLGQSHSLTSSLRELTLCEGDDLKLTAEFQAGARYTWETADSKMIANRDLIRHKVTPAMQGTYTLSVLLNGCTATAKVQVNIIPKPNAGSDGTLVLLEGQTPSESMLFSALGGQPDLGGTWTHKGQYYTYTVTGKAPCNTNASARVHITNTFRIPNGFSPNGDAINDVWVTLPNISTQYPQNELLVFNRRNEIVYQARPYKNDWNGKATNSRVFKAQVTLPEGPYYYLLALNDKSKTVLKGWVYIKY